MKFLTVLLSILPHQGEEGMFKGSRTYEAFSLENQLLNCSACDGTSQLNLSYHQGFGIGRFSCRFRFRAYASALPLPLPQSQLVAIQPTNV